MRMVDAYDIHMRPSGLLMPKYCLPNKCMEYSMYDNFKNANNFCRRIIEN